MEEKENRSIAAEKASEAAYELHISQETRNFLKGIQDEKGRRPSTRPLSLIGIAATLLVLIISVVTINLSHNDNSIADKYGINAIVARSGNNISNDQFREAVQKYYAGDYEDAETLLEEIGTVDGRLSDYKDWLSILIELKTEGSQSDRFNQILSSILANEEHEFYKQGVNLSADVDLFWRTFVVKK